MGTLDEYQEEIPQEKTRRPQYTPEQDQLIITRITAAKAAGGDLGAVFMALADEIGRPISGIKGRWNRLKKDLEGGGGDNEAGGLVKKLRSIRENQNDLIRQRDAYKMRAEKLEHQLKKMQKDHNALKQEYEALVSEVAAIIGQD